MNFTAISFERANVNWSSICSVGIAIVENGELVNTEYILIKPTPSFYDDGNTILYYTILYYTIL
jgi:DNA polymerase-3 subunit epsilon